MNNQKIELISARMVLRSHEVFVLNHQEKNQILIVLLEKQLMFLGLILWATIEMLDIECQT